MLIKDKYRVPKTEIEEFLIGEGGWTSEGKHWDSGDLYRAVEGLEYFYLPLGSINTKERVWGTENLNDVLYHMKRVEKADLKYPIIMDECGQIIDGWHRVAKAILRGDEYIKAVKLKQMPEPSRYV